MKKFYLIAAFAVMSFQFAHGQAAILVLIFGDKAASENFYFSLKGGLGFSNLYGLESADFKPGVHFGLSNNLRINDHWDFVPEFMPLSWKGARSLEVYPTGIPELDTLNATGVKLSRNLNYIDIPILMRYKLNNKIRFEFGPQVSILTSANDKYEASVTGADKLSYSISSRDKLKTMDFGFVVSAGYALTDFTEGTGIEFYVRYYQGFVDIPKESSESYKNGILQFTVSFPFIIPSEANSSEN